MEREQPHGYLGRPTASSLADVVEIVLDKGIVIDAYARVSLLGIEVVTLDARVAIASVDTYLRFAEATNRLDLYEHGGRTLPDLLSKGTEEAVESVASGVVERKVGGALDKLGETVGESAERSARRAGQNVVRTVEGVAEKVAKKAHSTD